MRLLVVDGSKLMAYLVASPAPEGAESVDAGRDADRPSPLRCWATVGGDVRSGQDGEGSPCQQVLEKPLALGVLGQLIGDILTEVDGAGREAREVLQ